MSKSNIQYSVYISRVFSIAALWLMAHVSPFISKAQDISGSDVTRELLVIEPLFEYPVAPDELEDLQSKTDWLMQHFWDPMDLKENASVDQNALNDAFQVYATAAVHAAGKKALDSASSLARSLKGNPVLLLQFAKGAEEAFYGPRAIAWSDGMFLPFLEGVLSEKTIPESRKIRFRAIKENLTRNAIGAKFPKLRLTLRNGRHHEFVPEADYTIVEIGNPDCEDCRFARIKLEMAADIMELISTKEIGMAFVVAEALPEEEKEILEAFKSYPAEWITGISYGADDILDIRQTPAFYILDKKGTILAKNLDVASVVDNIRTLQSSKKKK